jgi:hypothetical protein
MRNENIKRQFPIFINYAKILWNNEVKLKNFSPQTNENHASKSRHHAAGERSASFTSADAARRPNTDFQMSPACAGRPFLPGLAPANVAAAIAVKPSASLQAFAQRAG